MQFPKQITVVSVPYKNIFEFPLEPGQSPRGIEGAFLEILARSLKFEYRLVQPADGEWGDFRNGSWTGAVGMVARGEADLAVACLGANYKRQQVIDFSAPYCTTGQTFATFFPEELPRTYAYIYPFDVPTWIVLFALLVAIPPLLFAFGRGNSYPLLLLETFGNLVGTSVVRKRRYKRGFVVASWLLAATVVSQSYVCVLPSFLFTPLREQPVTTLKLLSERVSAGEFAACVWKGTRELRNMLESESEDVVKIGEEIQRRRWYVKKDGSCCSDTFGRKTAFITGTIYLELEYGQPPDSNMLFATEEIYSYPYVAIGVNKRFCCKKPIDRTVRRIFESGVFQHILKQEIFKARDSIFKDTRERRIQMKIDDIRGPVFILIIGHATSAFVLIIELFYERVSFYIRKSNSDNRR